MIRSAVRLGLNDSNVNKVLFKAITPQTSDWLLSSHSEIYLLFLFRTPVCRRTCTCFYAYPFIWRLQTISVKWLPNSLLARPIWIPCWSFKEEMEMQKYHISDNASDFMDFVRETKDKIHLHFTSFRTHVQICLLPFSALLCASVSPHTGKVQTWWD